jgi:hypothetical protein
MSTNYDSTKYADKRTHADPDPGTQEFGDRAKVRHAKLMEDAINSVRPTAADLGSDATGTSAGSAVKNVEKHRKEAEDILKEAGE